MNHFCDSNTEASNWSDIAIKDIKKGEEITSDYGHNQSIEKFKCKCKCGSKKCREII